MVYYDFLYFPLTLRDGFIFGMKLFGLLLKLFRCFHINFKLKSYSVVTCIIQSTDTPLFMDFQLLKFLLILTSGYFTAVIQVKYLSQQKTPSWELNHCYPFPLFDGIFFSFLIFQAKQSGKSLIGMLFLICSQMCSSAFSLPTKKYLNGDFMILFVQTLDVFLIALCTLFCTCGL